MTRKRFIKLVMSCGLQKRAAQKLALHYHAKNYSYEDAFYRFCEERFRAVTKALGIFVNAVREMGAESRETEKTMTVFLYRRATNEKAD